MFMLLLVVNSALARVVGVGVVDCCYLLLAYCVAVSCCWRCWYWCCRRSMFLVFVVGSCKCTCWLLVVLMVCGVANVAVNGIAIVSVSCG